MPDLTTQKNGSHSSAISLLAQGGRGWVAGLVYANNVLRALSCLPEKERPAATLFLSARQNTHVHQSVQGLAENIQFYTCPQGRPLWKRTLLHTLQLSRGRWPQSLETAASKTNASALFPVMVSLGRDFPVPWIGWIPDFQHRCLPDYFSPKERTLRDQQYQALFDEADHLIVSNETSKKHAHEFFKIQPSRLSVVPFVFLPHESANQKDPQPILDTYSLPEKYLLFPSQFWAHKNHENLFKAFSILKSRGNKDVVLVCTGATRDPRNPGHFQKLKKFVLDQNLTPQIRILGLIPRSSQVQLIRASCGIIQPSFFEGWSAVIEDALTFGKPILLSDTPMHREQDPKRGVFFDPHSAEAIAETISSQWPGFQPGVEPKLEQEALLSQQRRAKVFARNLLHVVEQASKHAFKERNLQR